MSTPGAEPAVAEAAPNPEAAGRLADSLASRMIKVDHAGEFGAINIYRAQIAVSRLLARGHIGMLRDFLSHEERHHATFADLLRERGLRRCRSWLLCGVGGYALGLTTALLGPNAVMVCTHAVEDVVNLHLAEQMHYMRERDPAAYAAVASIVADETAHQQLAGEQMNTRTWLARGIAAVVRLSTEAVIWVGMKL